MGNTIQAKRTGVIDTVLRDAHQSLLVIRIRTENILSTCDKLDRVDHRLLEARGGVTFDVCVCFPKEDPWEHLHKLKAASPNTRLRMFLRG